MLKTEFIFCLSKLLLIIMIAFSVFSSIISGFANHGEVGLRFKSTITAFEAKTSDEDNQNCALTLAFNGGLIVSDRYSDDVDVQGEINNTFISQKIKQVDVAYGVVETQVNLPQLLSPNTGKTKLVDFIVFGDPEIKLRFGLTRPSNRDVDTCNSKAVPAVKIGDVGFAFCSGVDIGLNVAPTERLELEFPGLFGFVDNVYSKTSDSYYILNCTKITTYS